MAYVIGKIGVLNVLMKDVVVVESLKVLISEPLSDG
jgi:hypothetical protein